MKRHSKVAIARAYCTYCKLILATNRGKARAYTHLICPECDRRIMVGTYGYVPLLGDVQAEGVTIVQSAGYVDRG